MKKTTKTAIWIAGILCAVGLVMAVAGLILIDFDFTKLSTETYATNTYGVTDDFDQIKIKATVSDVRFVLSQDDSCKVVCDETSKVKYSASVQDGTLVIDIVDSRKWYDYIGIFLGDPKLTLYLPKTDYAALAVKTETGRVDMPEEFSFDQAKVVSATGDVTWRAAVADLLEMTTDTGDIQAHGFSVNSLMLGSDTGDIKLDALEVAVAIRIKTDTGEMKISKTACQALALESDTGDITLQNVMATDLIEIENDTGDVELVLSDAQSIYIETSTGDVSGTLLSEKIFFAKSSTGDIEVPQSMSGGKCEIKTSTGDIELSVVH